jgi:alpha-L-fucosidase
MGRELDVGGFGYLPRQDRNIAGVVDTYRFETSNNGKEWTTPVAQGRFGNMRNNPVQQEVTFAPVKARYFRFTALRVLGSNGQASAAEITVLPPDPAERNRP